MAGSYRFFGILIVLLMSLTPALGQRASLPHSVVLEAEFMAPLKGANFSFQQVEQTTKGAWSLAGPGVAAEWTQGGESEFLSIAARADEPGEVVVGRDIEMPAEGKYTLWVRYADYRKKQESFGVRVKQGEKVISEVFGTEPRVDELDPMLMLWDFAFTWDKIEAPLAKGPARVELFTTGPTEARRHVDLIVLTTDESYRPHGREKPDAAAWAPLRAMRKEKGVPIKDTAAFASAEIPAAWKITDRPPTFVWNTAQPFLDELAKADGVRFPFSVDPPLVEDFLAAYRGKPVDQVPVYGSPLSGPTWHIPVYPTVFADGSPFLAWLESNPDKRFALLLNYGDPVWPEGADKQAVYANLKKYNDNGRCVGYIAGESFSHTGWDQAELETMIRAAKTRADVLAAYRKVHTDAVVKKFTDYYGQPVTPEEAWGPVISCLSADNEAFTHALGAWGCKRIGHENTGNSPTLARRLAFLRGAARQFGVKLADYQSANLGDSATMFSRQAYFYPASSQYILDNSYDAWAGAGTNWLLKDYLLFYLAGVDVFYNEQGVDIYWKPGGNAAGDNWPVQLSPKGKVAEAIVNLAENRPRGTQYTPVAFLLDEAHGYSQERFTPGGFQTDPQLNPDLLLPDQHEFSIRGWFDVAYFPAPDTQNEPATAIRQTYVAGIFGDIFDVIVTAPNRTQIAQTYPVIIAAGEVPLSEEWGKALKPYIENGGTLIACTGSLTGPGAAALELPAPGAEGEAAEVQWKDQAVPSNVFKFHELPADGADILATAGGKPIATSIPRGKGRLIVVSVPMGLGIDNRPVPLLGLLMREVTQDLVPVSVDGDVEMIVNRLDDGGWLVGLLNNRGIIKPQHGVLPTDHSKAQEVTLSVPFNVARSTEQMTDANLTWQAAPDGGASIRITVPAGMVRLVEVHPAK